MNMSFITIQFKSTDSRFPMNGKLINISNVHSIGADSEVLRIKYEDSVYQIHTIEYKMSEISYYFIS